MKTFEEQEEKKQCGLDVVLYCFSFIFKELITRLLLSFIVLAAALFLFRNLT